MIKSRWFFHPLFIFIFSLLALGSSLIIYIHSYLRVKKALEDVVLKYHLDSSSLLNTETWIVILILSLLVALILTGLLIIYLYSQKMIQLYRMQQNFINGFTHELKTPIASLQLFLDTFTRHDLPREDQLKYLDFMKKDTLRISNNVERLLQLSRLENKNVHADFVEVDLIEFINRFLSSTPHLFEEGIVSFQYSETAPVRVKIDVTLFEMLLMNLLTNALIYNQSPEKKIVIKLSVSKKELFLNFIDNGTGLEKNQLKKIFKKFYQVGKTTKGSGLGLYIVAMVAKLHKAEISAKSEGPGFGSTFCLKLKRQVEHS